MAQYGVHTPAQIPGEYLLGMPAPIGMVPTVITGMIPSLNRVIIDARGDHSTHHNLVPTDLTPGLTVSGLVALVWGKITEP